MFGLIDCNNFFVSCERVFRPDLNGKPVVVLSSNDGCIIARSNEAKALGIPMGAPMFKFKELIERENVTVFSGNIRLYGDMSRRVMSLLSEYSPDLQIYSIDEAFIDLSFIQDAEKLRTYGQEIVRRIRRGTGIPVTLGIAPTKTLAKVASRYGKKYAGYHSVCIIDSDEKRVKALAGLDVSDVWGVGRRNAAKLNYQGVYTAKELSEKSEGFVRRLMTVTGVRTWKELNGISCVDIEDLPIRQSICSSKSFSDSGLTRQEDIEAVIADHASTAAARLRNSKGLCSALTVFAFSSRFREDLPVCDLRVDNVFDVATDSTPEIVSKALESFRGAWRKRGYHIKKAGVILWHISSNQYYEQSFFDEVDREKQSALTKVMDEINRKNGYKALSLAVQTLSDKCFVKSEHRSADYTTDIRQVIKVKV